MTITNAETDLVLIGGELTGFGFYSVGSVQNYEFECFKKLYGGKLQLFENSTQKPECSLFSCFLVKLQAVSNMIQVWDACNIHWNAHCFTEARMTVWLQYMKIRVEKKSDREKNSQMSPPKLQKKDNGRLGSLDVSSLMVPSSGFNLKTSSNPILWMLLGMHEV